MNVKIRAKREIVAEIKQFRKQRDDYNLIVNQKREQSAIYESKLLTNRKEKKRCENF